jgi:hypothetical protein
MYYLYYSLLNVSVAATDEEVIAELKTRLKKGVQLRPELEQGILAEHHEAGQLYVDMRF